MNLSYFLQTINFLNEIVKKRCGIMFLNNFNNFKQSQFKRLKFLRNVKWFLEIKNNLQNEFFLINNSFQLKNDL